MTVLRPVVVLAPPAGHSSSHGWPGSPALFKRQAEASPQQKSGTCYQEQTCVADTTMGLRDPDTEAGWRGLPSRGELAPVMSLTTAPDISGYGPGPSSRYRPPPRPRPNLGRDPGLGRGGGEGNHECSVLVMF